MGGPAGSRDLKSVPKFCVQFLFFFGMCVETMRPASCHEIWNGRACSIKVSTIRCRDWDVYVGGSLALLTSLGQDERPWAPHVPHATPRVVSVGHSVSDSAVTWCSGVAVV